MMNELIILCAACKFMGEGVEKEGEVGGKGGEDVALN